MIPHSTGSDRLGLAIAVLLMTTLALSLGDALIKGSAGAVGIWQMFVLRSALALPGFAILILLLAKGARLWPQAPGWVALRVALLVAMWVAYYISLPHLPLSVAAAAYYTLPIFITLFSALLLGERISTRGWLAVALGFAGVIVILRPGVEGVNGYMFLPLLSAMSYALAMIVTRAKCRGDHPLALGLFLAIGFIIAGALGSAVIAVGASGEGYAAAPWVALGQIDWRIMAALALALVIGGVGTAIAYKNAPPSVLGVFDFSYVGYAVIWGLMLFHEVPSPLTLLGIVMIVLAGVLATWARRT